ncbi:MAG TPA: aminodeoxychorismate synthase component I [Solirubrobacteraceae bacterium]|jgi:para-aminobenzoate synthetase/4-amino-4-deoxychorismate lyase|nr:aminodeoxychorismate synthase component I [Solirubrobacteraceae bacterium]
MDAPAQRLVRERLHGGDDPLAAVRWLYGQPRPVALSGAWAGGGLLLTSHPQRVATADEDPFALLDAHEPSDSDHDVVAGGWFGWLGFGLSRRLEPVPPPPPRPRPLPPFDLAFHDHVVRCDSAGQWWFEALWSEARADLLIERRGWWRERLRQPSPPARDTPAGPLRAVAPGTSGHHAAVAETVARVAAGDLSQANICLRLEGPIDGDPLELWIAAVTRESPAHAAYIGGRAHAVASLSPELFLRRRGRTVSTRPIKGTAPRATDPAALQASAKDRAENVMIVDLMRNDLGRVCEYGSIHVTGLCEVEPAAGVWHLVSTVEGTLRADVGDGALLRATFPPGSVTGAPKVQALRQIHAVEATGREAYCGAVGFASPVAGLELNVAIRTFETDGERLWLGAGGGVVADSQPAAEVAEALAKARGIATAAGIAVLADVALPPPVDGPILTGPRPDPERGVFETVLVQDGRAVQLGAHLHRLRTSAGRLGLTPPADAEAALERAAAELRTGALRFAVTPDGAALTTRPLPGAGATALVPVVLAGGLGAGKWADRTLIDAVSAPGTTPLLCDLDGHVLEAGYAAVVIVESGRVIAPPLDGRQLPSVSRAAMIAAARAVGLAVELAPITLARARAADAVLLASALRGPHAGVLAGGPSAERSEQSCVRLRVAYRATIS